MVYVTNVQPTLGFYVKGQKFRFVAGRFDVDERIKDPELRKEAAAVLERIANSPFPDGVMKEAEFGKVVKQSRNKTVEQIEKETLTEGDRLPDGKS